MNPNQPRTQKYFQLSSQLAQMDNVLHNEFDRQVQNLLYKGYPSAAGLQAEDFLQHILPLKEQIGEVASTEPNLETGYLPFVLVIKRDLVAVEEGMARLERHGKNGIISLYPRTPQDFQTLAGLALPSGLAYLLVDIDRGQATLNVTPAEALTIISGQARSPLTIEEGIALLTHHPEFLQKNRCFSLLGSRGNDRRVPALWLSEGRPKLGWCWNGNPHTWLGSASCGRRKEKCFERDQNA